jgi:predicted AlkP superfamily pyrophosphatase or phosphodiesterase
MAERETRSLRSSRLTASLAVLVIATGGGRATAQMPGARHVVIIGVDGLSPDGIRKATTPTLHRMMKNGTSTLHARAVMPTVSSPNWASMIMGAGPEQHGVTTNDWQPDKFEIAPTATGPGGMFPTIFGLLRAQRPGAQIGCFHDWDGFSRLFERTAADVVEHCKGPVQTTEHAIMYLKAKHPDFTFIHLDHVDDAGHTEGHGTPAYYRAVAEADRLIGLVLQALNEIGMAEQTIVIVTSDHGGKGKGHGGATMGEIEIPWIIAGAGVVAGLDCKNPINTYDTAATVAYIFGLTPPKCWIARPVEEAFSTTAAARR